MKKLFLLCIITLSCLYSKGQLNPIKDLNFSHSYQEPYNCWELWWTQPDSSLTDTLIGYNIYRDTNLYTFTTNTIIGWNPCIGNPDTTNMSFMQYNMGNFYIHVTAVYNKSHIESLYNDSTDFGGIAIGINENLYSNKFQISPNPFFQQTTLQTGNILKIATLTLYNSYGQTVKQIKNISGQTITLHRDNLPSGLYFLRLTEGVKTFAIEKILITD